MQWKQPVVHSSTSGRHLSALEAQGLDLASALFIDLEKEGVCPTVLTMTMAAHDSSARWRTFLTEAKEDDILLILSKQSEPYLDIPFHELQAFDPEFADDILQHPSQILDRGSQTLVEICRERGEDIDAILRVGELPRDSRRNLRDIGNLDVDRLRSVEVIITKISDIKPRIHIAIFNCEACGNTIEIKQKNER